MPAAFSRTLRSLAADGARSSLSAIAPAAVLLGLWLAWFLLARVAVYATSDRARLEVAREVNEVQAPVTGRLVATHLLLGREVKAGDPLIELDAEAERLRLEEERKKGEAAEAQLAALREETAAQERSLTQRREAAVAAADEAKARFREADEDLRSSDRDLLRLAPLRKEGLVSEAEVQNARSAAGKRKAAAEALSTHARSLELNQKVDETEARARIAALRREEARLSGLADSSRAAARTLAQEIERKTVRAAASGRLGKAAPLQLGAFVKEGDSLGAIVPKGALRVVAEYLPQEVLGRVRAGQIARLRLDGFAWTQYGSLPATVVTVGNEAQGGRVRVELSVQTEATRIPVEHGLPGTLEVEIDRVSPATLLLRAAAGLFPRRPAEAPAQ